MRDETATWMAGIALCSSANGAESQGFCRLPLARGLLRILAAMRSISLRCLFLLSLGLACAGSCLLSAPARACIGASCSPGIVAPDRGASVPANVPGFPVTPEQVFYWPFDSAPASTLVELLDGAGQVVPTDVVSLSTAKDYALVPKGQLDPGSYRFRRQVSCIASAGFPGGTPSLVASEERAFTVTTASALPADAGTVEVGPAELVTYRVWGTPACTADVTASLAKLAFKPSAELAPFLSVARIEVRVDGNLWVLSQWGIVPSSMPVSSFVAYKLYDELFTTCVGPSGTDRGLPEGAHQGTLTVWLPNLKDPLPPISFAFSTSCAGAAVLSDGGVLGSDGAPSPDAEAVDVAPVSTYADGGSPPFGPVDSNGPDSALATAADTGTQIAPADAGATGASIRVVARRKGGCGYVGSPASGGAAGLLVLLGLACVLRRRTLGSDTDRHWC
jgi:hypothetical protein